MVVAAETGLKGSARTVRDGRVEHEVQVEIRRHCRLDLVRNGVER